MIFLRFVLFIACASRRIVDDPAVPLSDGFYAAFSMKMFTSEKVSSVLYAPSSFT